MPGMDRRLLIGIGAVILVLAGLIGYALAITSKLHTLESDLAATTAEAEAKQAELARTLAKKTEESESFAKALAAERNKNGVFESQISDITGTVGTLEKLAKTDPELLAKYSKIYFLNENYVPASVSPIPGNYLFEKNRTLSLESRVLPRLTGMLTDAKDDDVDLLVISAYRSFGEQASLKARYRVTYGSGANAFSADQGYSEHQLGTTIDFTTASVGASFTGFDATSAYTWLTNNAWRYGFVLSYPKDNTYYQYEPWHWRFVGTDLAKRLHEDKEYFYDLDQRTIDGYLAEIFD